VLAGPLVALASLALAYVVTRDAGVPLRDPDGVASSRLFAALALVVALVLVDIVVRAYLRAGRARPARTDVVAIARERWTRHRVIPLAAALFCFFATYFAYRNLKSVVPLIRPDTLYDDRLTDIETGFFGGEQPAALLHDLLGTGVAAHVLSSVYLLLFIFIPVTLATSLVFSTRLDQGLFYSTALGLNWIIGAGSYYLLPSLGPFAVDPAVFSSLPDTAVRDLQELLSSERAEFLANPEAAGAAQSIGAFASLHVSIFVTGALAAHLLGLPARVKAVAWTLTVLTVLSTIYFGWHYLLDDVGGVVLAAMSLGIARVLTGVDLAAARRRGRELARRRSGERTREIGEPTAERA